ELARPNKFSTYANLWILDQIQKAVKRQPPLSQERICEPTQPPTVDALSVLPEERRDLRPMLADWLSPGERRVVALRFGLDDGIERTNEEVAELVGLSPRWVGVLLDRALDTLRRNYPIGMGEAA